MLLNKYVDFLFVKLASKLLFGKKNIEKKMNETNASMFKTTISISYL